MSDSVTHSCVKDNPFLYTDSTIWHSPAFDNATLSWGVQIRVWFTLGRGTKPNICGKMDTPVLL